MGTLYLVEMKDGKLRGYRARAKQGMVRLGGGSYAVDPSRTRVRVYRQFGILPATQRVQFYREGDSNPVDFLSKWPNPYPLHSAETIKAALEAKNVRNLLRPETNMWVILALMAVMGLVIMGIIVASQHGVLR